MRHALIISFLILAGFAAAHTVTFNLAFHLGTKLLLQRSMLLEYNNETDWNNGSYVNTTTSTHGNDSVRLNYSDAVLVMNFDTNGTEN